MIYDRQDSRFIWAKREIEGKMYYKSMKTMDRREAARRDDLWYGRLTRELITGIKEVPRYTCKDAIDKVEGRWRIEGKLSVPNVSLIKQTRASFGSKPTDAITTELLDHFVQSHIEDGYAVATANRQIQLLRRGFHLLGVTWPQFELPSEAGNVREGFFTPAQMAKLLAALPADLSDFTEFAWSTGLRKGAARQITWQMVNKNEIRIPAGFMKNRKAHTIPLIGTIREIINRRTAKRTMDNSVVFTWDQSEDGHSEPICKFRDTWRNACVKAGCENMRFHDIRRSAVRDLINSGVDQATAMSISGHKTISTFQRYQIVTTTEQAKALEKVQRYRAG